MDSEEQVNGKRGQDPAEGSPDEAGSGAGADPGTGDVGASGVDDEGATDEAFYAALEARASAGEGSAGEAPGDRAPREEPSDEQPTFDASGADDAHDEAPAPRRRGHVAPALIALDRIDDDDTFRVRPEGDTSLLATDLARLGQLFPIDLRPTAPDRFQIICGFRRVAALRFLQREGVLARVHTDLSDEDALLMALAAAIHEKHVSPEELQSVREQLDGQGRLFPEARDMLEKALAPGDDLAPEGVEEEVDADELASDVTERLGDLNQDLALLADVFGSLDDEKKAALLEQLRYSADLVAFLEGK